MKFAHKMMNTLDSFIFKVFKSNIDFSVLFHEINNVMFDKYEVRDFVNINNDALCSRIFMYIMSITTIFLIFYIICNCVYINRSKLFMIGLSDFKNR